MEYNFRQGEKIRLRAVFTNGNYYDEVLYGMTCEEFEAIYKKVKN